MREPRAMIANLAIALALALAPADLYNQGNRFYAQKDYARAAQAYRQALAAGPNADVDYNLGNALFKSGKIGQAIVEYRRARYLRPRDADIAANLAFARSYRVDKVLVLPSPMSRAFDQAFHWLSVREAAWLAGALFALAGLSLSIWIVRRWSVFMAAAAVFGALSLFCLLTERVWIDEVDARPAVVVAPEVSAQSGPGEEFKQILLVHDGTEVRIREARGAYLLVQLPGGSGGWVPREAVAPVYPR